MVAVCEAVYKYHVVLAVLYALFRLRSIVITVCVVKAVSAHLASTQGDGARVMEPGSS